MNDAPITDFDKLKNTLIEIGGCIQVEDHCLRLVQEYDCSICFYFGLEGEYLSMTVRDESYPDD